jgi:hypothetical protein
MSNFALPKPGDPLSVFEEVARQLNSVALTEDQIWRGYKVHWDADADKLRKLIAWATREGLNSPDVAAHAIVVRGYAVMETLIDGAMLDDEAPKALTALLKGPLYPADLGWFEALRPPLTAAEAA